jgi:hypothetical protein
MEVRGTVPGSVFANFNPLRACIWKIGPAHAAYVPAEDTPLRAVYLRPAHFLSLQRIRLRVFHLSDQPQPSSCRGYFLASFYLADESSPNSLESFLPGK